MRHALGFLDEAVEARGNGFGNMRRGFLNAAQGFGITKPRGYVL